MEKSQSKCIPEELNQGEEDNNKLLQFITILMKINEREQVIIYEEINNTQL